MGKKLELVLNEEATSVKDLLGFDGKVLNDKSVLIAEKLFDGTEKPDSFTLVKLMMENFDLNELMFIAYEGFSQRLNK